MGIRIHKCIGYGIEGDTSQFITDDFYYNSLAQIPKNADEIEEIINHPEYVKLFKEINGNLDYPACMYDKSFVNVSMQVACGFEEDGGFIFTMEDKWFRYDDIIDWAETPTTDEVVYKWLDRSGIYPFEGQMICERDCASGKKHDTLGGGDYNQMVGKWSKECNPLASGDKLESYKTDWRCTIPVEMLLTIYLTDDIIHKEKLLKTLKPCIATWWC